MNTATTGRSFTLTLTGSCNLNCVYCYEHQKNGKNMSFETAKEILDKEMSKDVKGTTYIELFGGEPFIAFDLIKQIYDYVDANWHKKDWIMFATTNGTLVHGEIQDWLKTHKRFICGLSLDGTKAMQDYNRSNSFDKIDLEFFKKQYPFQAVKMTVSQKTLETLAKGVEFIHKQGFDVNCNLAFGIDWSDQNNKIILERELKKLIEFYIKNPSIKPCSMLDMPIEHLGLDKDRTVMRKWCGTGTDMCAYYLDGRAYPCQFFMPISAGEDKAAPMGTIEFKKDIPVSLLDEKCQKCDFIEACPTCYGSNYISTGSIYSKDDNLCQLTKIILKARSYFKAKQWLAGQIKLNPKREQALLRSIVKIQENL